MATADANERPYDLLILGAGSGGLTAAAVAAGLGARVALVEARDRLGGDCALFGCVPSKTLLKAAKVAHTIRQAPAHGLPAIEMPRIDFAQVMRHVQRTVDHFTSGPDGAERYAKLGVDVFMGAPGRFERSRRVRVGDRVLEARHVIIATGSRPAVPRIPGIEGIPYITNERLYAGEVTAIPGRLLVLGGGPIGVETAQAFHRLGARVTLIEPQSCILTKEDHEVGCWMRERLLEEGIDVRVDARVTGVAREAEGALVTVEQGADSIHGGASAGAGKKTHVRADAVFLATGRRANVESIGLERAGVMTHQNGIVVDAKLRTSAKGVYAIGDVTGGLMFTHVADAQAKVAVRNVLFPGSQSWDDRVVPWTTFTDPEVARVGVTEEEARRRGESIEVHRWRFGDVDRAITDGETDGFLKVVATPKGCVLGAHVAGPHAGELIQEFALAMRHDLTLQDLATTIHVYPTFSLANRRVADQHVRGRFEKNKRLVRGLMRLAGTPAHDRQGRILRANGDHSRSKPPHAVR